MYMSLFGRQSDWPPGLVLHKLKLPLKSMLCSGPHLYVLIQVSGKYCLLVSSLKKDKDVLLIRLDYIIPLFHADSLFSDKISEIYEDDPDAASEVIEEEIAGPKKDNHEATG